MPRRVLLVPVAALLGALALSGCAPVAAWKPPAPLADAAAPARRSGRLERPAVADSTVVVLYGDNRPGWRTQSRHVEFGTLRGIKQGGFGPVLGGIAMFPVWLVETIVPTLDGPRDLVDKLRHRPTGGGEKRVLRSLDREPRIDLVVNIGDIVHDGRRGRLWQDWWTKHRELRERVPYFATPGNHERLDDATARANFEAAIAPGAGGGRFWHSLELPQAGTRLVFLDTDVLVDKRGAYPDDAENALAAEQLAWADSVLALPAGRKFVCLHHPLVSAGRHGSDWSPRGADHRAAERREALLAMCAKHGVSIVFAGHEHLYQRVWVHAGDGRGFWHVTNGGGGSPLHYVPGDPKARVLAQPMPAGFTLDAGTLVKRSDYAYSRLVLPSGGRERFRLETFVVDIRGNARPLDRLPPVAPLLETP